MAESPYPGFMHKYLRAWREHRGLSQQTVGDKLRVTHSTISRWERGLMPISTSDLMKLAKVYEASTTQLLAAPQSSELVALLDKVQVILETLPKETVEHWIAIGESLGKKP